MSKPSTAGELERTDDLPRAVQHVQEHERSGTVRDLFHQFSHKTSSAVGTPPAFVLAVLVVLAWAISGPLFGFSDTWQLVINTGTTIVTFLMVFLIQNTQNRDAKAIHLKLDELIRAGKGARNALVDLEDYTDEELDRIERQFKRLRQRTASNEQQPPKRRARTSARR